MSAATEPRIGSLCSGYGGLDLAVLAVLGGHLVWVADSDPAAGKLLQARWPAVPNLGDITAVDWHTVAKVDVVTAGFPCQDISHAGTRTGITGPRSGLWRTVAAAVGVLRPGSSAWRTWPPSETEDSTSSSQTWPRCGTTRRGYAYAHLTWAPPTAATASSSSPPPPSRTLPTPCARDGKGRGYQRGLPDLVETPDAVLLPTPTASTYGSSRSPSPGAVVRPSLAGLAPRLSPTRTAAPSRSLANVTVGRQSTAPGPAGRTLADAGRLLPTPLGSDSRGPGVHGTGSADLRTTVALLPTPRATDGVKGSPGQRGSHGDLTLPSASVTLGNDDTIPAAGWGVYQAAVDRWASALGRPAPRPVQPGTTGKPVLAPSFVEWLMGLSIGSAPKGRSTR